MIHGCTYIYILFFKNPESFNDESTFEIEPLAEFKYDHSKGIRAACYHSSTRKWYFQVRSSRGKHDIYLKSSYQKKVTWVKHRVLQLLFSSSLFFNKILQDMAGCFYFLQDNEDAADTDKRNIKAFSRFHSGAINVLETAPDCHIAISGGNQQRTLCHTPTSAYDIYSSAF